MKFDRKFPLVVTIVVMLLFSVSIVNFWLRPASRGSFCTFPGKGQGASGQAEGQTTARSLWSLSRHGLRPSKVDGQSIGMSLVWDRFLCMPGLLQLQFLVFGFFHICLDDSNTLCRDTTRTCTPTTRVVFGFFTFVWTTINSFWSMCTSGLSAVSYFWACVHVTGRVLYTCCTFQNTFWTQFVSEYHSYLHNNNKSCSWIFHICLDEYEQFWVDGLLFCSEPPFKSLFGNSLCRNTARTCTTTTPAFFGFSRLFGRL